VMHAADERVGWNTTSIISAIRKHAVGTPVPPLPFLRMPPPFT
jgi:hypothetical protein